MTVAAREARRSQIAWWQSLAERYGADVRGDIDHALHPGHMDPQWWEDEAYEDARMAGHFGRAVLAAKQEGT